MATNQLSRVIQTLRGASLAPDEAKLTDGQLLENFVLGREETAFAALVRRHGPLVWGVCRRVLHRHQDAEDAFQATFLVLVRKAASVMPREMIANWLYGVAHQTALKARATTARRWAREKQVKTMPEPVLEPQGPWDDLQPRLDQELSRLPDKYRAVIVLCDLEGKTRKEAARHFAVPEGTVASRLATARTMLARRLSRQGLSVSGATLAATLSQNAASASVPGAVTSATIKAATLFAAGPAAAPGAISVKAVALAEGVLKTMLLTKLKIATAVLAVIGVLGTGAAALTFQRPAEKTADPGVKEKRLLAEKPTDQPAKEKKEQTIQAAKEKKADDVSKLGVSGVVKSVDAATNTLTVTHREGEDTFCVARDAKIEIDGKPGQLTALPVGANVNLNQFVDAKTVGAIQAGGRSYYNSSVKAVDGEKHTITVKDRDGEKTFPVAQDACISVDGKGGAKLTAIPAGAFVNITLGSDQQTVRFLGADGPCLGDCGGSLVKAVDAAQDTITFDDKVRGEIAGKSYTVAKDALITIDGKPGTLAAVPAGCYVNLQIRVDGQTVGQVRAQGPSNVCDCGGSVVKAIDIEKGTITFDDKARAEVAGKTFSVAKGAIVVVNGKTGKLDDLPVGCYVQMNLCVDRQTAGMLFANGPGVAGIVKAVDVEKKTITVEETTYSVASAAIIVVAGKQVPLADLTVGASVNLSLHVDRTTVGMIQTK